MLPTEEQNGEIGELAVLIAESARDSATPFIVAIDGRSGAGKSTLAQALAAQTGAAVIDGDDFYSGGTAAQWDALSAAEKAAHCIDWRRQRSVLETLVRGETATWHPYDWNANDGRLSDRACICPPSAVVILEGAYSARPELADLLNLRVLLDVPDDTRQRQLTTREGDGYRVQWEARWAEAEEFYFTNVMPVDSFDLVISSPGGGLPFPMR